MWAVFILLGKYLGVGLLDLTLGMCLTLYKTAKFFSKVAVQFHVLISNVWVLVVPLYSHWHLVFVNFFFKLSNSFLVPSHGSFSFSSLITSNVIVAYIFIFFLAIYISTWKCLLKSFVHLENWSACFLIEFWASFIYFGYKSFIRHAFCKYFPPVFDLSFHFINSVFQTPEILYFD